MENVWEATDALASGPIGTGWEDQLGHILVPIAVLFFLSNVSSMRLMLSLKGQSRAETGRAIPRLTTLFMGPVILYGISHVTTVYATLHPEFRPFALAVETVTAVSWVVAVARLSAVIIGLQDASAQPGRPPVTTATITTGAAAAGRGLVTLSKSGAYPRPPSANNVS